VSTLSTALLLLNIFQLLRAVTHSFGAHDRYLTETLKGLRHLF